MIHTHISVDACPVLATHAHAPYSQAEDRVAAGRHLASLLRPYQELSGMVLALTPGGVVVAGEVARALRMPLDVLVSRTFVVAPYTTPAGAVCERAGLCLNGVVWQQSDLPCDAFWRAVRTTEQEVLALTRLYRHGRAVPIWRRRLVMLVDDGLESGLAQLAALQVLRRGHARRCIVATPYGTPEAIERVAHWADVVVAPACSTDPQTTLSHWQDSVNDTQAAALLEQYRQSISRA